MHTLLAVFLFGHTKDLERSVDCGKAVRALAEGLIRLQDDDCCPLGQ